MSDRLVIADQLARHFHKNQKYGKYDYYARHLVWVADRVIIKHRLTKSKLNLENLTIVALLHDIIEDTRCEIGTIINIFGNSVGDAVVAITKNRSVSRPEYLDVVKQNPLATFVKICDAEVNRDSCPADGDESRAEYYQDTIDYLKGENK